MAYRPIRTCADAARHGFFLEVTCGCGRVTIFDTDQFFTTKWFSRPIEMLAAPLRCQGAPNGQTGCGHRGASIRFVTYPPTPPKMEMPKPVSTPASRGFDQDAWGRADERERKRLINQVRG